MLENIKHSAGPTRPCVNNTLMINNNAMIVASASRDRIISSLRQRAKRFENSFTVSPFCAIVSTSVNLARLISHSASPRMFPRRDESRLPRDNISQLNDNFRLDGIQLSIASNGTAAPRRGTGEFRSTEKILTESKVDDNFHDRDNVFPAITQDAPQ